MDEYSIEYDPDTGEYVAQAGDEVQTFELAVQAYAWVGAAIMGDE